MKTISTLFILFIAFSVSAQETPDPSVLKSEIKNLEKVVKEQEKDIAKLEKELAKIRPDAEQAMRDAKNITEMRDRKKAEFEAFEYDKKKAELKALEKESKSTAKDLSKTIKSKEKLSSKINEQEREAEILRKATNELESKVAGLNAKVSVHSDEEKSRMKSALKGKEPADSLLLAKASSHNNNQEQLKSSQKQLSKEQKALAKTSSNLEDAKAEKSKLVEREALLTDASEKLVLQVSELDKLVESMDPKAIQKELSDLQKQASEAAITYDNLNSQLVQQQTIIDEKHDILESKKQEIREKTSILDKL